MAGQSRLGQKRTEERDRVMAGHAAAQAEQDRIIQEKSAQQQMAREQAASSKAKHNAIERLIKDDAATRLPSEIKIKLHRSKQSKTEL